MACVFSRGRKILESRKWLRGDFKAIAPGALLISGDGPLEVC